MSKFAPEMLSDAPSAGVLPTAFMAQVQGADDVAGPWTDLAQGSGGAPFAALVNGIAVSETGAGVMRNVAVGDPYQTSDLAHPKRFLRLFVQAH